MFSIPEKRLLGDECFLLIRKEEQFIEVMSKLTGHIWMILKRETHGENRVVLYHKHYRTDKWYHEQWKTRTVKSAVASIKQHDAFVLEHQ